MITDVQAAFLLAAGRHPNNVICIQHPDECFTEEYYAAIAGLIQDRHIVLLDSAPLLYPPGAIGYKYLLTPRGERALDEWVDRPQPEGKSGVLKRKE